MTIQTRADLQVAQHVKVLLRGLRLARNTELAHAAIKAEREVEREIKESGLKEEGPLSDEQQGEGK